MQQALNLFPETGTVEMLVEESMPWFMAWSVLLSFILVCVVVGNTVVRVKERRSPVERVLRRRVG